MKKFLFLIIAFLIFPYFVLASDKVEINTASLEQLDTLIGIGPTYAQRIIDGRPYSSVDDLIRVNGIGEITLQKIKDQGLTYIEGQTQPIIPPVAPPNDEVNPTPTPTPTPEPTPSPTPPPTISYPPGIIFNELLPSPEGADQDNEWIEIYNQNNFEVNLSGWQIKDSIGTITTYTFPKDSKIEANGFLILKRPDTKIILNNDGDELNLMQPDKSIIEIIAYEKAPLGQSYNRVQSDWFWSSELTPAAQNNIKIKEKAEARPLPEKNKIIDLAAKASFVELAENNFKQKNLLVWLVSFFIALLSAAAIFILKKSIP